MKLKFVLVPFMVLGFAVGGCTDSSDSSDCSKDEIIKLIDKGYSKTEIDGLCGKSESKSKLEKWITTSDSVCKNNGGEMIDVVCTANWSNAKNICSASGGSLPSIDELKRVVMDCGGTIDDFANNRNNSDYQSCYKRKGFASTYSTYWSSTTHTTNTGNAWYVYFDSGDQNHHLKRSSFYVRCVRAGQ